METQAIQKEILLLTGSSFTGRSFCKKSEIDQQLPKDQLLEACWNGMIQEMLPEICGRETDDQAPLFLWQVKEANAFLELDLGPCPSQKDPESSIDPYLFCATVLFN